MGGNEEEEEDGGGRVGAGSSCLRGVCYPGMGVTLQFGFF